MMRKIAGAVFGGMCFFAALCGAAEITATETTFLGSALQKELNEKASCATANMPSQLPSAAEVAQQIRKAVENAKLDRNGRPTKIELASKSYQPILAGDTLQGFYVDGELFTFTTDANSTRSANATIFVRDKFGELSKFMTVDRAKMQEIGAKLPNEAVYSLATAAQRIHENRGRKSATLSGREKFDGDWDTTFKPCFICDAEFTIDAAYCSSYSSVLMGAAVALGAGACVSGAAVTLGTSCYASIILAAATIAAIDTWYQNCNAIAMNRLVNCRSSCS